MAPPSLNIEFILQRLYQVITGASAQVDLSSVPYYLLTLVEALAVFGIVFSVVLLFLILYYRARTLEVEHHGFHELEHAALVHHEHAEHEAKNPRWEQAAALATSSNDSDWRRAIIEADIMLEQLLRDRGYTGGSLGDMLKLANPLQFTTLDLAWEAHRMRNAIAHLGDAFPLTLRDVQSTMSMYQRVFEEFDFI